MSRQAECSGVGCGEITGKSAAKPRQGRRRHLHCLLGQPVACRNHWWYCGFCHPCCESWHLLRVGLLGWGASSQKQPGHCVSGQASRLFQLEWPGDQVGRPSSAWNSAFLSVCFLLASVLPETRLSSLASSGMWMTNCSCCSAALPDIQAASPLLQLKPLKTHFRGPLPMAALLGCPRTIIGQQATIPPSRSSLSFCSLDRTLKNLFQLLHLGSR